jgi:hypothetical protein
MNSPRANFSSHVKDVLAGRGGYRCSIPSCRVVTIGPGVQPDQVARTGTASHIFSAARGGPRGQGGLTLEQLESVTNGIWLCHRHARLVDANDGDAYPASYLIAIRNLHEAWVAREQGDASSPFGWIQDITVGRSALFTPNSRIRFGKVTVVFGLNESGKSALYDWIAGASSPGALWRWLRHRSASGALEYVIKYFDPFEHVLAVAAATNSVRYVLDGRTVPHNPIPFRIVTLAEPKAGHPEQSDLDQLAELLAVDFVVVRNLLESIPQNPTFSHAVIGEDGSVSLNVRDTVANLSWRQLSHGEQTLVAFELAIALAGVEAEFHPTVLLLDWGVAHLDNSSLRYLTARLSAPANKFQTIIVSLPRTALQWEGWQSANLTGRPPNVMIEQEVVGGP